MCLKEELHRLLLPKGKPKTIIFNVSVFLVRFIDSIRRKELNILTTICEGVIVEIKIEIKRERKENGKNYDQVTVD